MMLTSRCKICNNLFEAYFSFVKYCGDSCRKEARRRENNRYVIICKHCGAAFRSSAKRQQYCSVVCGASKYHYNKDDVLQLACDGINPIDIATTFNASIATIRTILYNNNISATLIKYSRPINSTQKSLVRGGLLGDAHACGSDSGKYRICFRHGPLQYQYLDWKYSILINLVNTPPKTALAYSGAFGKESRTFATITNINLTTIAQQLYTSNGTKCVNINYLNSLDQLSIAVWFMDDGSLRKGKGGLATHNFTKEESELIAFWLSTRYGTKEPKLVFDKRCQKHSLRIHVDLTNAIASEIDHIVSTIPCMAYKTKWYHS